MRVAIVGAGFTPGEADLLRKSMATFKHTGGVSKFRDKSDEGSAPSPRSLAELRAYVEKRNAAVSSAPSGPILKSGMRVRHPQFGDGIVLNRERTGNDVKLTITFSRVGRKILIERYAKLKIL